MQVSNLPVGVAIDLRQFLERWSASLKRSEHRGGPATIAVCFEKQLGFFCVGEPPVYEWSSMKLTLLNIVSHGKHDHNNHRYEYIVCSTRHRFNFVCRFRVGSHPGVGGWVDPA